ncbi:mCG147470 [Mus musculus]|nr:mCG147470 [Mus musculus]
MRDFKATNPDDLRTDSSQLFINFHMCTVVCVCARTCMCAESLQI